MSEENVVGLLTVRIIQAKNLPVMDRKRNTTDCYAQFLKNNKVLHETETMKNTLTPKWDSEVYNGSHTVNELLEDIFIIKVFDEDRISGQSIGVVHLDLSILASKPPLVLSSSDYDIKGWYPIFDSFEGLRGEIEIEVNYKPSKPIENDSVAFFYSSTIDLDTDRYILRDMDEFIEELVVDTDPEYERNKGKSVNEKRQLVMWRLTHELKLKMSLRVNKMKGNLVLGYRQEFDIEGDSGLTLRGYGNVWRVEEVKSSIDSESESPPLEAMRRGSPLAHGVNIRVDDVNFKPTIYPPMINKGQEYYICGLIGSRSIKYLEKLYTKSEDIETRDGWWREVRQKLQSTSVHLYGNYIIGYNESATINGDICVLSCDGTSIAIVESDEKLEYQPCVHYHFPEAYIKSFPKVGNLYPCRYCKRPNAFVPEVLFCSLEIPPDAPVKGKSCFIIVSEILRLPENVEDREVLAGKLSSFIIKMEKSLNHKLLFKLSLYKKNAIFRYKYDFQLGDNYIVGIITGTAVNLLPLPEPQDALEFLIDQFGDENENESEKDSKLKDLLNRITDFYDTDSKYGLKNCFYEISSIEKELIERKKSELLEENKTDSSEVLSPLRFIPSKSETSSKGRRCLNMVDPLSLDEYERICREDNINKKCTITTTEKTVGISCLSKPVKYILSCNCFKIDKVSLSKAIEELINTVYFTTRKTEPSYVNGFNINVRLLQDDVVFLYCTGICTSSYCPCHSLVQEYNQLVDSSSEDKSERIKEFYSKPLPIEFVRLIEEEKDEIYLSPSNHISGRVVKDYIGCLNLHLVRESKLLRSFDSDSSDFYHSFFTQVNRIVRAYVRGVKGNAVLCYNIVIGDSGDDLNEESSYIAVNITGDIVKLSESRDILNYYNV